MSGAERFPDGAAIRKAIRGGSPRLQQVSTRPPIPQSPTTPAWCFSRESRAGRTPGDLGDSAGRRQPAEARIFAGRLHSAAVPSGRKIVYARRTAAGYQLEIASLAGGKSDRITYAAGNVLPDEVLADGRIVFETSHPGISGPVRELYTVYSDGSGVEAYRCDHGRDRHDARQITSRDLIFVSGTGLAKFTPALAHDVGLAAPPSDFSGGLAEGSGGVWLVSARARALQGSHSSSGSRAPPDATDPRNGGPRPRATRCHCKDKVHSGIPPGCTIATTPTCSA